MISGRSVAEAGELWSTYLVMMPSDRAALLRARRGLLVVGVAATFSAACRSLMEPALPAGAEEMTAPAVYARWWSLVEACSDRSGSMSSVRWYRTPGSSFALNGQREAGMWRSRGNRIVIAGDAVSDGSLVRHEMLHALLRVPGHPPAQFRQACSSLVSCLDVCADQARKGWRPPSQYVGLPPESLAVSSTAELMPRESDGQRWVSLWVTARNPLAQSVRVSMRGNTRALPTFGYDLQGPAGGIGADLVVLDSSTSFFAPRETKRWLFEFRVADSLSATLFVVPAGQYLMRGAYARRWTNYDTLTVTP